MRIIEELSLERTQRSKQREVTPLSPGDPSSLSERHKLDSVKRSPTQRLTIKTDCVQVYISQSRKGYYLLGGKLHKRHVTHAF